MVSDMKKIFSFYKSIQNIESLDIKSETLVRGVAGSGKTTIAINRALRIVRDNENNMFDEKIRVAYVVYNGVLVKSIEARIKELCNDSQISTKIEVMTLHQLMYKTIKPSGKTIDTEKSRTILHTILKKFGTNDFSFYSNEIAWIKNNLVQDFEQYKTIERKGRGIALNQSERQIVWNIYEQYRIEQAMKNIYDFDDYAPICLEMIKKDSKFKSQFTHIIADETQDYSKAMMAFLREFTKSKCGVTLFQDDDQDIYSRCMTMKNVGFNIVGKSYILKTNYRNSGYIALAAKSLIGKAIRNEEAIEIELGKALDNKVKVLGFNNQSEEFAATIRAIENAESLNSLVLFHAQKSINEFLKYAKKHSKYQFKQLDRECDLKENGVIWVSTIHSAKGLGFENVHILGVDSFSFSDSTQGNKSDSYRTTANRKLLYTAMTRAKSQLTISYSGSPATILGDIDEQFIDSNAQTQIIRKIA